VLNEAELLISKLLNLYSHQFDWTNKELYALWLAQEYYAVRHTTKLLCLTSSRSMVDDFSRRNKILSHCAEEIGHEHLAYADVLALGYTAESFPAETFDVRAMYQSVYYMIERVNTYSICGYGILAEGVNALGGGSFYNKVSGIFGNCKSYLELHKDVDILHYQGNRDFIEKQCSSEELEAIFLTMNQCYYFYNQWLQTIIRVSSGDVAESTKDAFRYLPMQYNSHLLL